MLASFSVTQPRTLFGGSYTFYQNPFAHPSRVNPNFHDFVYMIHGKWDVNLNGELYSFEDRDVVILPAGLRYGGAANCSPGTKTFYFHVFPVPGDSIAPAPEDDGIVRFTLPTVIHCGSNVIIPQLFEEIALLAGSSRPDRDASATALIHSLIFFLAQVSVTNAYRNQDLIGSILHRMRHAPDRFFKETEIAAEQFVSVKTLRAVFLQRFGKTFYQYQLESKLSKVCLMLQNQPNIRLKTVAAELGFCDEFHLSKVFKRVYGISPSEYRRRNREDG